MTEKTSPDDRTPMLRRYDQALDFIDQVSSVVVVILLAVLCVVICAQVFYRYVLDSSIDWALSVPRVCFVLLILLSIPLGFRRNSHVGITIVLDRVPDRYKPNILRFNAMVMAGLMIFVAWLAYQMLLVTWDQLFPSLPVSIGVFYAGIIFSAAHTNLHLLRIFWTGAVPKHESAVE
ncbi:MAG: TRAP transporter small permease [Hyphomicrobiales bacterium]